MHKTSSSRWLGNAEEDVIDENRFMIMIRFLKMFFENEEKKFHTTHF